MNLSYEKIINHPNLRRIIERQPGYADPHQWVDIDASRSLKAFTTKEDLVEIAKDQPGNKVMALRALMRK